MGCRVILHVDKPFLFLKEEYRTGFYLFSSWKLGPPSPPHHCTVHWISLSIWRILKRCRLNTRSSFHQAVLKCICALVMCLIVTWQVIKTSCWNGFMKKERFIISYKQRSSNACVAFKRQRCGWIFNPIFWAVRIGLCLCEVCACVLMHRNSSLGQTFPTARPCAFWNSCCKLDKSCRCWSDFFSESFRSVSYRWL